MNNLIFAGTSPLKEISNVIYCNLGLSFRWTLPLSQEIDRNIVPNTLPQQKFRLTQTWIYIYVAPSPAGTV